MEQKDYYKVLGITEEEKKLTGDEFTKIVKSKYKKLALRFHPDRHVNDTEEQKKEAEENFKEINEANAILSDPQKREQYDNGGMDLESFFKNFNFGGHGGSGFGSFFRNFGFGFGSDDNDPGMAVSKGSDVGIRIDITLEEAYRGADKTVSYAKKVKCDHCHGTRFEDGKSHVCSHCNGTGREVRTQQTKFGMSQTVTYCSHCNGTGMDGGSKKCTKCGGTGYKTVQATTTVHIPAGIEDGMRFTVRNAGDEGIGSGQCINGDLIVMVSIKENSNFTRVENGNLIHYMEVPFNEALLGFRKKVKMIDGSEVELVVPECTPDGKAFFFNGKGMPILNYGGQRGACAVVIKYKYPSKLTSTQRDVLSKW